MVEFDTFSEEETMLVAQNIAYQAKNKEVYALYGDLGVGKTAFTRGFAKGLGVSENVTSPTFSIVKEYADSNIKLYHFDVYRIDDPLELYDIGYDDYLSDEAVCLIEWANKIEELLPKDVIRIIITKDLNKGLDYRKISISKEIDI